MRIWRAVAILVVIAATGMSALASPNTATAAPEELVYVSNSDTQVALSWDGEHYGPFKDAVPTWVHEKWPSIEGATWIATSYWTERPQDPSWRKFVKTFTVHTGASAFMGHLELGTDDSYQLYMNGEYIGGRTGGFVTDEYDVVALDGENEMVVIVKNADPTWIVTGPKDNPTGLIYKLDLGEAVLLRMLVDGCGITSPAVGDNIYVPGAMVPISAVPCPGWVFEGWTGPVADPNSAMTTVTLDTDKTVVAHFSCTVSLTMQVSGSGTTDPSVGMHDYSCGALVPITATADPGWSFAGWTGGPVANPSSPVTTVTMSEHKTVTANFDPIPPNTLTMQVDGCGSTGPPEGDHDYAPGTVVTISADPCPDWTFINWTGNVADPNSPTTTVTMNTDKTVTANFAAPVILTMAVNGCGTTVPAVGTSEHALGEVVSISADPCPGWQFTSWTGAVASPTSATTTVTMNSDKTVTANFEPITYTLTVSVDGCGNTTPSAGSYVYDWGEVVPVCALPCPDLWVFGNWTGDVEDPDASCTTVTMDSDKTITAHFLAPFTLTVEVEGCGSTTPSAGAHMYAQGTVVDVCAVACPGDWAFGYWTGDVADPNASCTTVTMDSDKTVTAHVLPPMILTMQVNGCGLTSPSLGSHSYTANSVVDISVTPCPGWQFDDWTGDVGNASSSPTTVTMNSDKTVTANLSPLPAGTGIQLAVILDGSASIDETEWATEIYGLYNALQDGVIPRDGSVELTVIQFADTSATTEIPPTPITASNWDDISSDVLAIVKRDGITPIALGIHKAVEEITASPNYSSALRRIINISSDVGEFTLIPGEDEAVVERNAAIASGIHEISAEGIGDIRSVDVAWLRDSIVWPQPGTIAPPYTPGWVARVDNATEFEAAIAEKLKPAEPTYSLAVTSTDGGSVTEPGEGIFVFPAGTVVDLAAVADTGWLFQSWTGSVANPSAPVTTVTMNHDQVVSAVFVEGRTLEITSDPGGSVTVPGEGIFTYATGTVVDLVATDGLGWAFDGWTGNVANPSSATTSITLTENEAVHANFREVPVYTLAITSGTGGVVTTPGEGSFLYNEGTVVSLTATPSAGWAFDSWTSNVANALSATTTITMNDDQDVTATFYKLPIYRLAVGSTEGGSVMVPGEGVYDFYEGAVVNLTAAADPGYAFDGWVGDVADTWASTTTITMTEDEVVTARFVRTYTLTITSSTGGSVTDPGEGVFVYKQDTVVALTATRDTGWAFDAWTGNVADPSLATTTIMMTENRVVSANFVRAYILALSSSSGGAITTPGEGVFEYKVGTVVELAAQADFGKTFLGWAGNVADPSSETTSITMYQHEVVVANFSGFTMLTLTVQVSGNGTVSPDVGTHEYAAGTVVNLLATADEGNAFVSWTGGAADPTSAVTTVTMNSNKTITANFLPTHTLTIEVSGSGTTTPVVGEHVYPLGTVVDVTAYPAPVRKFDYWTGDVADTLSAHTTVTIDSDKTITAHFSPITDGKTLTIVVIGSGATTPEVGSHLYYPDAVVQVNATAASGWKFISWSTNVDNPTSPTTTVTMNTNKVVSAYFYTGTGAGTPPVPTPRPTAPPTRTPAPTRTPVTTRTPAPTATPVASPAVSPTAALTPTSTSAPPTLPPTYRPSPTPAEGGPLEVPWSLIVATVAAVVGVGVLFYALGRKAPK